MVWYGMVCRAEPVAPYEYWSLDRYMLHQLHELSVTISEAYDSFAYHRVGCRLIVHVSLADILLVWY
jgi:isoleucyl-tRNA synthetase